MKDQCSWNGWSVTNNTMMLQVFYTVNSQDKIWTPRKRGFTIGRLYHVSPGSGERYYLRTLLNFVKGPTSFEEIRTVNGVVHPTFKDACYAMGLLDDDKEYIDGITEASFWGSAYYLRKLFAMLLISGSISRPEYVWDTHGDYYLKMC